MLGKTVTVTVTQPAGSVRDGVTYPINYGYIQNKDQNGETQPACVVGPTEPLDRFTGTVLARATRPDGTVCFVVAPRRAVAYEPELRRYLRATEPEGIGMRCRFEKSCGAVLFTEQEGERRYLLVKNRSGFYGFPKGHIEGTENEHETARREIGEETGLRDVTFLPDFCEINCYLCRATTKKRVVLFLAKFAADAPICPSFEIHDYRLLPFEDAVRCLGHRNDKEILRKAEAFLASRPA